MSEPTSKHRLYLSGQEIYILLKLTEPSELDPREVTTALQTARVTLRKKMIELEEGTASGALDIVGKKPSKYSTTGLGFSAEGTAGNEYVPTDMDLALGAAGPNYKKMKVSRTQVSVDLNAEFDKPMVTGDIELLPGESIMDAFQRTGLWSKMEKVSEDVKKKRDSGETIQDRFINPRFQIKD